MLTTALLLACGADSEPTPAAPSNEVPAPTATAISPTATPVPPPPLPPPVAWRACGGGFECGAVPVPLDYSRPAERQIEIAVIRQQARVPSSRIGSLVMNPGGPGNSGVDFLRPWAPTVPGAIRDRFDLVAFDPRGVGQSSPLNCQDNIQQVAAVDPSPDSPAEWTVLRDTMRAFAGLCADRGREILAHLGTANVIRDMDLIRHALGDEKLTYLGFSYGTVLGAGYAARFPDRVRAMALDGQVDWTLPIETWLLQVSVAFEQALARFSENCVATRCVLASQGSPIQAIDELMARLETAPIPAPGADRPAGIGEATVGMFQGLYTERLWPDLATAVDSARRGNGAGLIRLADLYLGRMPDGRYGNVIPGYTVVDCLDYGFPKADARIEALTRQEVELAPHFGAFNFLGMLPCAYLQVAQPQPQLPATIRGVPPILIVGTTGDPATPYAWAKAVNGRIESSVLLTNNGNGHTVYTQGSACIDTAVNQYLLSLTTPPAGTSCGPAALSQPFNVAVTPVP